MYKVGQVIEGYISGIQPYGAFVYIDEQTSGLIHISELSDGFVHDISQYVQIGDKVYLKILDVGKTGNQLRLSLKAVYQKPLRRQRYKHSMQHLPNADLGFTTLARMLPEWIKQAKGETND